MLWKGFRFITFIVFFFQRNIIFSVPSILRNSRYRRDQRQMDEEEEMWFNEDDEFDDNEAIVPAATTDILSKKLDTDLESIGKIIEKKAETNGPKMNNNSTQKATVLNNNPGTGTPSSTPTESKSALFKRVSIYSYTL